MLHCQLVHIQLVPSSRYQSSHNKSVIILNLIFFGEIKKPICVPDAIVLEILGEETLLDYLLKTISLKKHSKFIYRICAKECIGQLSPTCSNCAFFQYTFCFNKKNPAHTRIILLTEFSPRPNALRRTICSLGTIRCSATRSKIRSAALFEGAQAKTLLFGYLSNTCKINQFKTFSNHLTSQENQQFEVQTGKNLPQRTCISRLLPH